MSAAAVERRDRIAEAFAPLVPLIARRIFRQRPHVTTQEDLEQAGLLGLLEAVPKLDAYLCRRIEGAMRDATRKRDYVEAERPRHEEIAPMADPAGSLDDFVLLSELWRTIERELTPRDAKIIELVVEGRTGPEIGAALGITQQAVSKAHLVAVQRLRGRLAA